MTQPTPRRPAAPPAAAGDLSGRSAAADQRRLSHQPSMGRGLVWSDLVQEMEREWAAKQAAAHIDRLGEAA